MVKGVAIATQMEAIVGDKSPKAKQHAQKQKAAAEAKGTANAKAKQESYTSQGKASLKGKK